MTKGKDDINFNLDDIQPTGIEVEESLKRRIRGSSDFATVVLFLFDRFVKMQKQFVTVNELKKFFGGTKEHSFCWKMLQELEIFGIIARSRRQGQRHHIYLPLYNDKEPKLLKYVKLAMETLGLK